MVNDIAAKPLIEPLAEGDLVFVTADCLQQGLPGRIVDVRKFEKRPYGVMVVEEERPLFFSRGDLDKATKEEQDEWTQMLAISGSLPQNMNTTWRNPTGQPRICLVGCSAADLLRKE